MTPWKHCQKVTAAALVSIAVVIPTADCKTAGGEPDEPADPEAINQEPALTVLHPPLLILEDYAVKFRYPGLTATPVQARSAMQSLRLVRQRLRTRLGI